MKKTTKLRSNKYNPLLSGWQKFSSGCTNFMKTPSIEAGYLNYISQKSMTHRFNVLSSFCSLVPTSHRKWQFTNGRRAVIRNCCEPNLENTLPSKIVCNLRHAIFHSAID